MARESFLGGEKQFQIQAYPFRLTPANLARHRTNPNMAFWRMLKEGNDHFEVTHLEPKVDVCDRHYVFDAQPPANSTKPLVFSPTGRCPAYEVPQEIAGPALEKQRNDDYQIAQLVKDNAPVAPITLGTDGGMNRVFVAKLETTAPVYDNEGHLHAPPVHPGMPAPTLSGPREDPVIASTSAPSASRGLFGNFFDLETDCAAVSGRVRRNERRRTIRASSAICSNRKTMPRSRPRLPKEPFSPACGRRLNRARPNRRRPKRKRPSRKSPRHKSPTRQKLKTNSQQPQQDASAAPTRTGSLISGAQPVVPSDGFQGRWAGLQ